MSIPDRYLSGLSGEERRRRAAEIKRGKKTKTDDKSAYSPSRFKTDEGKKTKTSKYTKRGRKLLAGSDAKTKNEKLAVLAKKTGYSTETLQKVYDRGLAAWRTGHRPGASQHAWAMARVYSFVTGGKTTKTADKDLVREAEIHFMTIERQLRRKYSDRLVEISIRGMSSKFIAGRARQWATQAAGAAQSDRIIRGGKGVTVSRDIGGAGGGRFVSQIQQAQQARANAIKAQRRADRLRGRSQNGARLTFGDPLFAPVAQRVAAQRREERGTAARPDIPEFETGGFRYSPEFFGDGTEENRRFAPYDADLLTGAVDAVLGRPMLEANRNEVERALEEVLPGPGTKNQEFVKEFNRRLDHLYDLGDRLGIAPMMKDKKGNLVPVPRSVKSLAAARKLADQFDSDKSVRDNTFPGIKERGTSVDLGGGVSITVNATTIKKIVGRKATEDFVEDLWWTDMRTQAAMREILMRYYDDPEYRKKMVDDISWYPRMRGVLWTLAGRMAPEFGTDQDTMFKRLSFSIANLSANRNWFEDSIDKETGKPTRTLDDLEALYRGDISIDDLSGKERNDNVSVVMLVLRDFLTPSKDNPGKSVFDDQLARARAGETDKLYGIQYNQQDTMEKVASSLMGDIDADLQLSIERVRDQGLGYLVASSKFAPSQKFDTFGTGNIYGAAPDGNTHDQRQGMLTQLMLPSIAGSNNVHAKKPSPAMFYAGRTAQHRLAERLGLPPEAAHALQSVEWEHWSNFRRYRIREDGQISIDPRDKKFMPSREHPEVVDTVMGGRENPAYRSSVAAWERRTGKKYKNPEERAKERQKKKAMQESGSVADPMPTAYERNKFVKAIATIQFGDIQEMAEAMQEIMVIMMNMKRREKANTRVGEFVEARLRDPKGGLTAAGRAYFKRKEGANLKPGVKGAADTPEKMRRKGSFLTRFYTNPSGPMVRPNGKPSRLALAAAAWGEPVPKTAEDARRLAAKGRRLLAAYERSKKKKA